MAEIQGYDGRPVFGAFSRGGVFAAYDWKDLVFGDTEGEILQKAKKASGQLKAFPENEHEPLKRVLGLYSDVQSINSEDTVTWSVFHHAPAVWLPTVLELAFGVASLPALDAPIFWQRIAHPDTGRIAQGPEADVVLNADGWRYVVEAKWGSDIDRAQGREGNMTQLAMRAHLTQQNDLPEGHCGVLVVVPGPSRYRHAVKPDSTFRTFFDVDGERYKSLPSADALSAKAIAWEEIASILSGIPSHRGVAEYLNWRLDLLKSNSGEE